MKKLESSLVNMAVVLTAVAVIAGLLLGYVNQITAEPIANANAKSLNEAITVVMPKGYDNNPTNDVDTARINGILYKIYKATRSGEFVGAAVESSADGFGGKLTVLVGFDKNGNITDYSLLEQSETPGLGEKAKYWFKPQAKTKSLLESLFHFDVATEQKQSNILGMNPGKTPLSVSKDGGNVDAITASTITSRAFLNAINNAYAAYAAQNGKQVDVQTGASQHVEGEMNNK